MTDPTELMTSQTDQLTSAADNRFMAQAIRLAARGLGQSGENPCVGCVLVGDGRVIATAYTAAGGRPHAETQALEKAAAGARGATAYVTLEPCAHEGRTRPCCAALVAAGVRRVVIALADPDDRVSGRGIAFLQEQGVAVSVGVLAGRAAAGLGGYLSRKTRGRPRVIVKTAASLDGRFALANGKSQWITGPEARAMGHLLRARADGILVGSGTVLADTPALTCRLAGLEQASPIRVVLDRRGRIAADHPFYQRATERPVFAVTPVAALDHKPGVTRLVSRECESPSIGSPSIETVLTALGTAGLSNLLVEGGAGIITALYQADMIDDWHVFYAAQLLGGDARPMISALTLEDLPLQTAFRLVALRRLGADWLVSLTRSEPKIPKP